MVVSKVKICCISSFEEALLATQAGAHFLGLVGPMPSGPGIISLEEIAQIVKALPFQTDTVLLTSSTSADEILAQLELTKVRKIQIVDEAEEDVFRRIKKAFPETEILQVVHVEDRKSIDYARSLEDKVDYLLLDSGKPSNGILGGTGNTHDWSISAELVAQCKTPVFLAGGINAMNVQDAVHKVRPFGVDLCSGVRSSGKLDKNKLEAFFNQIKTKNVC